MNRFNSIKVQLELNRKKDKGPVIQFQFHKGAIRTTALAQIYFAFPCFNSIKVQLELAKNIIFTDRVRSFNSIKVQLEPRRALTQANTPTEFQFHKGAIRTV